MIWIICGLVCGVVSIAAVMIVWSWFVAKVTADEMVKQIMRNKE